jgi:hypothetical protein
MGEGAEGYLVRHRDRWYINTVRECLGITSAIQKISGRTVPQYRLKIIRAETVDSLKELLKACDWSPRQAQERRYPSSNINDKGFCRAWVELHSSVYMGYALSKKGQRYPQKKLQIYGNYSLIEEMNYIFSAATGLKPRTLQKTSNNITKAIYYQGKTVEPVVIWLYDGAEIWNPSARRKLEFVE